MLRPALRSLATLRISAATWPRASTSSAWSLEVPSAEVWCPENPHRYRLVAQLIDATGYVAQIEARFGLRKIEARGRKMYLNNEPIYLDGILYQPGTATFAEMKRHMHAMKALGCNLVRRAHRGHRPPHL